MKKSSLEYECPVCFRVVRAANLVEHARRHAYLMNQDTTKCWCGVTVTYKWEWRAHFREEGGILRHMRHGIVLGQLSMNERALWK